LERHGWKKAGLANLDLKQLISQLMAAAGRLSDKPTKKSQASHLQSLPNTKTHSIRIPNAITTGHLESTKGSINYSNLTLAEFSFQLERQKKKNNRQQFYALGGQSHGARRAQNCCDCYLYPVV
jgi:hypothetical protein